MSDVAWGLFSILTTIVMVLGVLLDVDAVHRFTGRGPLGVPEGWRWLAPLAVIILGTAAAPLIYRNGRSLWRYPFLATFVASGILISARLPVTLAPSEPGLQLVLRVAVVGATAYLVGKLVLLHRFSALHGTRVMHEPDDLARLLDYQQKDLERLRTAVLTGRSDSSPPVVQLVGRWGDGKSYLLERLGSYAEQHDDTRRGVGICAVVVVNVWEHQTEPDLHLAIVERVLGHRRFWFRYGWLRYPLTLYLVRVTKDVKVTLSAGGSKAEAEVKVPRPTGKVDLERLVTRVRRLGCRTVVVLDEIDRAVPLVAQAAVTLSVQALNIPGVVVVLSYVDELIRYKAFNPLITTLPDLASTMSAVIFAAGPERDMLTAATPGSLARWDAWRAAGNEFDDGTPGNGRVPGSAKPDESRLDDALRLAYAYSDVNGRKELQRQASEKYLGTRPIRVRPFGTADVARMVVDFDGLAQPVGELVGARVGPGEGNAAPAPDGGQSMRTQLMSAIADALTNYNDTVNVMPPVRALEGELYRRFTDIGLDRWEAATVSPQFIAAVVLAARYDAVSQNL